MIWSAAKKKIDATGDHDEHHDGGDRRLAAGRPGDLGGLRAHFLQELERADCHRLMSNVRRQTRMNFRDPNSRRWPSPLS